MRLKHPRKYHRLGSRPKRAKLKNRPTPTKQNLHRVLRLLDRNKIDLVSSKRGAAQGSLVCTIRIPYTYATHTTHPGPMTDRHRGHHRLGSTAAIGPRPHRKPLECTHEDTYTG